MSMHSYQGSPKIVLVETCIFACIMLPFRATDAVAHEFSMELDPSWAERAC